MERYISICKPFLRYRFDIKSWYYIVTVVTFSVIYNTPRFFEWMTISEPIERPCLSSLYQQGNFMYYLGIFVAVSMARIQQGKWIPCCCQQKCWIHKYVRSKRAKQRTKHSSDDMHHQTQYILCLFYSARLQYRNDDANFRANSAENSIGISTFVPYMLLSHSVFVYLWKSVMIYLAAYNHNKLYFMYNVLYIHFLKLYFGTYVMGTLKRLDFFSKHKN